MLIAMPVFPLALFHWRLGLTSRLLHNGSKDIVIQDLRKPRSMTRFSNP
jgi:hypothetical protein